MLDLNHALKLEPRNYIAFFELGITMEATDRPKLALKTEETSTGILSAHAKATKAH